MADNSLDTAVMKVGGSIITDRTAEEPTPDEESMHRTAEEISGFNGKLVLIHGAGSYGHPQVKRSDLHEGVNTEEDRHDMARIQRLQNELNALYCSILHEHGIPAFPVQPSAFLSMSNGELLEAETTIVEDLLELGLVPVLYGVPAHDNENDVSVLSGDVIAPYIAKDVDADIVLHATDVDGVLDSNGQVIDELHEVPDSASGSSNADVSGGMRNKIKYLLEYGQNGRIFSGKAEGNIERALVGEELGTFISRQ